MDKVRKVLKTILEACQEIKAEDVKVLNLEAVESYADFILIVTGQNQRQIQSLADHVIKKMRKDHERNALGVEGLNGSQWVLIDYGDVICHVFDQEMREVYHLEDMWPHVSPLNEAQAEELFAAKPRKKKVVASEVIKRRVEK